MDIVNKLINLLPQYEEIKELIKLNPEAQFILKKTIETLKEKLNQNSNADDTEECYFLVQALVDKCWEEIHTGHFSEVSLDVRKTYALGCFCKIIFLLLESTERLQIEKCNEILDDAILLGCTQNLFVNNKEFVDNLTDFFDNELDPTDDLQLPIIETTVRRSVDCDILQLDCPSLEEFNRKCFTTQKPALLLNTIMLWPALTKWRNLNYILKLAGNRTVPIEIGSNYATDEWSQQLMKIKDFLKRQFSTTDLPNDYQKIEYLAQHELFEQIPQLKQDFTIPDYCQLGEHNEAIDIKAWLGPKGTISPMHYDPKHNILCQVFGTKKLILASPTDTENLYPHEGEFLSNTSQINAALPDLEKYPRLAKVKFYNLTLQPGDCVYMPPKWWHYVESESPSFSVSFWWQ
ncbi:bifunctional peptidase and arginyl-hydroxylase JMJD5 [Musca vetustissima]|uniref:bifunctional peptidase and arginyl-hydroxylase JMJD5 n=1 Tax=Musca vetustissima TaxID=27455 RepID=UPI002AB77AC6|nr:bifunctional peptidase and arginyl-hydroxylase JMJD5 [Musca vetustissima]